MTRFLLVTALRQGRRNGWRDTMNLKSIGKATFRTLVFVFGGYAALLIYLYFKQRELIFVGSTFKSHLDMRTVHGQSATLTMAPTSEGHDCAVLTVPSLTKLGTDDPNASSNPYILFFYGNGSSLSSSMGIIYQLQTRGFNVCSVDYPGYGDSTGKASEAGSYEAATLAYNYLTTELQVPASKIVVMGWSLGSAVAIDLATRVPYAGLITCGAFTSMVSMSNHLYPVVPVALLNLVLQHPFDNLEKVKRLTGPMLMVHGRTDRYIPYEFCDTLHGECTADVTRYTVGTGDHDQLFLAGGAPLYEAITSFCHQHIKVAANSN